MTAALILYAIVTSACVAIAALAAETLLRQLGRPVRWAWAGALAVAIVLTALAPVRQAAPSIEGDESAAVSVAVTSLPLNVMPALPRVSPLAADALQLGWLLASGVLLALVIGVQLRYRALRTRWPVTIVDGEPVRVSTNDGPAVMGFWRPDIVVPRWFLARDEQAQRIVVRHEREHLRAGDNRLLAGATLAAVLMPWNPAMWWMLSRLRLAVELDCDARVLRAGTTAHVYGNLLIDVAALNASRSSAGRAFPALALLNPPSNLKRRLIAMHPDRIRFPRVRASAAAVVAFAAIVTACNAALPTDADVASFDAESASRAAHLVGVTDSIVYVVDGVIASENAAHKIMADEIAYTEIVKKDAKLAGRPTSIHIATKRGVEEKKFVETKAPGMKEKLAAVKSGQLKEKVPGTPEAVKKYAEVVVTADKSARDDAEVKAKLKEFTGLLVIDGVIVRNTAFGDLPQMDIASVEVIKGDAAQQLYGEQAKAGVIKITTKR